MYSQRIARIIILLILTITGWLGYHAYHSNFDYEFEKFFPTGNTDTKTFETFRNTFENDYDFLLIALENREGIFQSSFLYRVDSLAKDLSSLKYIKKVTSPTDIKIPLILGTGIQYRRILHPGNDSLLNKDIKRIYKSGEFVGNFFSADSSAICIIVHTKDQISKKKSDILMGEIERTLNKYTFDQYYLAGKIKAQQIYLNKMQNELMIFLTSSILFVLVILIFIFRSVRNVLILIMVVLFSVVWQLGIMQLLGKKIDILHILLPTILFIVGMSDAVHILSKYGEELRHNTSRLSAIRNAIRKVGLATFLTSATTAVGFFSLTTSIIQPIREFGIYTGVGVIITYIITILLLPASIIITTNREEVHIKSRLLDRFLKTGFIFSIRRPKLIIAICSILACIGIMGSIRVKTNNYLLEDLKPNEPLKKELIYFENTFSGNRPFEMVITPHDTTKNLWNHESIRELEKIEQSATMHFKLGAMQSPLLFIRFFNRAIHSGATEYFSIPEHDNELDSLLEKMRKSGFFPSKDSRLYITDDYKAARFSGRMHDVGSYKAGQMEKAFNAELTQSIQPQNVHVELTGSARLIDKNISFLSTSLIKGFGMAFVIIAIMFGLLFKSFKIIPVALIPNILPLVITSGFMGFTGIDLKISTSIIFIIGFGIAVDDTIHLLSRYRVELARGRHVLYALKRSYLSGGKAIILASVIILSGFITMIGSSFQSILYIGLLITILLFSALLSDLFLLPALIIITSKKKKKPNTMA